MYMKFKIKYDPRALPGVAYADDHVMSSAASDITRILSV